MELGLSVTLASVSADVRVRETERNEVLWLMIGVKLAVVDVLDVVVEMEEEVEKEEELDEDSDEL